MKKNTTINYPFFESPFEGMLKTKPPTMKDSNATLLQLECILLGGAECRQEARTFFFNKIDAYKSRGYSAKGITKIMKPYENICTKTGCAEFIEDIKKRIKG